MKTSTAERIATAIQILHIDGYKEYTMKQLAAMSGITTKTLSRNRDLVNALDFALDREGYTV